MKTIKVRNPRTGLYDYQFEQPDASELADIAHALRAAQKQWEDNGVAYRCNVLGKLTAALKQERDAILEPLRTDTGRARESAIEVNSVLSLMESWIEEMPGLLAPRPGSASSVPGIETAIRPAPYPLVGAITPWNVPLLMTFIDIIPGLLAGSAALVKSSEITPRFVQPLNEIIADIPELAAALRIMPGDGQLGSELIRHVDQICFTGSVATGKKVALAAAQRFIPCQLELGGKDPAIVMSNTDIERTAAALCWAGMGNAGQSCLSIERVYVEADSYQALTQALARRAESLHLNAEDIDTGEIGPIILERQRDTIETHLQDARDKGATVECGGEVVEHGGGLWCQPTILSSVNHDMLVMTDETFAPIIPVMPFTTEAEAIELANDTTYGLSAAVFSDDQEQAQRIASRLEAGGVSINDAGLTSVVREGEKQSFKLSGMGGSRVGSDAVRRFLRARTMYTNTSQQHDPWWF